MQCDHRRHHRQHGQLAAFVATSADPSNAEVGWPQAVGVAERIQAQHPDVAVGGGIGGLAVCIFVCESFWTPWVNASMLIGDDHNLELGAGLSVWFDDDLRVVPSPLVAYRYQPTDGGFFFRLSVNGLITFDHDISIVPWPGLALGGTWLN